MNEFVFTVALLSCGVAVAALWVVTSEVLRRCLNNDWCRHEWSKWQDVPYEHCISQHRYCTKCNKMEKRTP